MMTGSDKDIIFVILQFLRMGNFQETLHKLEQESGVFFNMKYFGDELLNGNWDEVEKYLSGFTKLGDNQNSNTIFFQIRKQKYLEALDKQDRAKALDILIKDLSVFETYHHKEMTELLTLENIREHAQLSNYGDTKTERKILLDQLKNLIGANPLFGGKLQFRTLTRSSLRTIVNQRQQLLMQQSGGLPLSNANLVVNPAGFPLSNAHRPFQPAPVLTPLAGGISNPSTATHLAISGEAAGLSAPTNSSAAALKHPRSPLANPHVDYPSRSDYFSKGTRQGGIFDENDCTTNLEDVQPKLTEEAYEKSEIWKITEISEPAHFQSLRLPDKLNSKKISRLTYTNSGTAILAIASNAIHLLWKWPKDDHNLSVKATASVFPEQWQPRSDILMTNDLAADTNPEEVMPCFALTKGDTYLISSSGGKISLFDVKTFMIMRTFFPPPPVATFLICYPKDNNIIVIGMEDSTIKIYNPREDKIIRNLEGHNSKRITGLAFSTVLNVLVSSDEDTQLCVWNWNTWEKQKSTFLQIPAGRTPVSDTRVQFQKDQIHFLVVHQTQLALYESTKLERVNQWVQHGSAVPITDATLSCDSQFVYASFLDATVCVFSAADLRPQYRINPSAYLLANVSSAVYPLVIAAHPSEPNQFALGLTDGGVYVIEPVKSYGKWGGPTTC